MGDVEVVFEDEGLRVREARNKSHMTSEFPKRKNHHVRLVEPRVLVVEVHLEQREILPNPNSENKENRFLLTIVWCSIGESIFSILCIKTVVIGW